MHACVNMHLWVHISVYIIILTLMEKGIIPQLYYLSSVIAKRKLLFFTTWCESGHSAVPVYSCAKYRGGRQEN